MQYWSVMLADVVVVMWTAAAAICSIGHGLRTFTTSRTYAVLAVEDDWRAVVLADIGPPPPQYAALGTGCAPLPLTYI